MPAWKDGVGWQNRTVRDDFDGDGGVVLKCSGTVKTNTTGN